MILRSEVERGLAKHRRMAADSLVEVPVTAYFQTAADAESFLGWFFGDINAGADWFSFTLPRTGAAVQARVKGGDIGELKPAMKTWAWSERSFVLEYVRQGFAVLAPGLHNVDASRILSVQSDPGTYIDGSGVLQTAAANVARYQGGQLLVEGAATNRSLNSQNLTNASWSGSALTSAAAEVWAGSVPFWTLTKVTTGVESTSALIGAVSASETLTATIALLAGNQATATLGLYDDAGAAWGANIDSNMAILSGPGTLSAQNGGRIAVSGLSTSIPTLVRCTRTYLAAGTCRFYLYLGGSSVGQTTKATRLQVEGGSTDTSYKPTTTAAVSRAADLITVAA